MNSVVWHEASRITVEKKPIPTPPEGWSLVKVAYSGICGSDLNIYVGAHPRAKGPLIFGHEISGALVSGHPTIAPGTPVTMLPLLYCNQCEPCSTGSRHVCKDLKLVGIDRDGGMAEYVACPSKRIVPLPANISLKLGALVEPVAVGVHAVRQAGFLPGDNALVFGAGPIGLCVAACLKLMGANRITVVERSPFRLQLAKELGFETIDAGNADVIEEVSQATGGKGADYTFDCAAHPSVSKILTRVTKVRGRVVIVGAYKKPAPLDLIQVMFRELTISGVRVYTPKDFEIAADMIQRDFPFEKLITHSIPYHRIQEGLDILLTGGDAIKVLIEF